MKDTQIIIEKGLNSFRDKCNINWNDMNLVIASDVLSSMMEHGVLYKNFRPNYMVFEPENLECIRHIAEKYGIKGVEVFQDKIYGNTPGMYVFTNKMPVPKGPFPPLPPVPGWTSPFALHHPLKSTAAPGEITPFRFHGELYRMHNNQDMDYATSQVVGYHSHIRRESDDAIISTPWEDHYYVTAFVWKDRCYAFGKNVLKGCCMDMTYSDDLLHWSPPVCIMDLSDENTAVFNNGVVWDGKRFVMLYEAAEPNHPIFTHRFLESDDLLHWRQLPDASYGRDKYVGGPALYWIPEDGYYYVTYCDQYVHPTERRLNYRTLLTRSKDLIHWEDAPEGRGIAEPIYSYRAYPETHPDVYEFNASDSEFIEDNGLVRMYFLGGNQLGVTDNQIAECPGTLASVFASFFY